MYEQKKDLIKYLVWNNQNGRRQEMNHILQTNKIIRVKKNSTKPEAH